MKHVFVETNWVVDCCAPAHRRVLAAVKLLGDANSGKISLHLPVPCLSEARSVIRTKFQPNEANRLREFLKWAKTEGHLEAAQVESTRQVLDQFEGLVKQDFRQSGSQAGKAKGGTRTGSFSFERADAGKICVLGDRG